MRNVFPLWICFSFLFILAECVDAQNKFVPIARWYTQDIDRAVLRDSLIVHSGNKPLITSQLNGVRVNCLQKDTTKVYTTLTNYLYRKHLVEFKHEDVWVAIDPLLHLAYWRDYADTTSYADTTRFFQNTRGIQVQGTIGQQFGFVTGFYENQGQWPEFMRRQAEATGVAPGMGRWKRYKFHGFDYSMSYAQMHYSLKKWLTIRAGQGKHFIGHGYRSLLLSDVAYNYPFVSADLITPNRHWQYTTRYFGLQTLERMPLGEVPEALFKRKAMTMHYLSWSPNSKIEIGFFEGIVWNRFGSKGSHMPSWGAYVPVIGLNTALLGWEQANNVITGMNARISPRSDLKCYGQFVIDAMSSSQMGWQAGIQWFDAVPRLDIQLEYNHSGSLLYSHDQGYESYSHFNQSLGAPTLPGSDEVLGIIEYRYRRWVGRAKYNRIISSTRIGAPWYDSEFAQQRDTQQQLIDQMDAAVGYRVNMKYNLEVLFHWMWREHQLEAQGTNLGVHKSQIFGISIRTNLHNLYNDF